MAFTLSDYQVNSVNLISNALRKGFRRIGIQLPTGGGKTAIAKHIIEKSLGKKKRVFFILRGNKLMEKTLKVFNELPHGVIWANQTKNIHSRLMFVSAPTYITSRKKWAKQFKTGDLFFIDEAHDCTAEGYKSLLEDIPPEATKLGMTATFLMVDGKGHKYWEDFVVPATGFELEELGYLPHLEVFCPPVDYDLKDAGSGKDYNRNKLFKVIKKSKVLYGDIIKNYKLHNPDKLPTIAFCINIQHCVEIGNLFSSIGVRPLIIHSKLSQKRKDNFDKNFYYCLDNNIPFIVCSVDMMSRGVDYPELQVGLHLRPTKSKLLWIQQVGRLTRKIHYDTEVREVVKLLDFSKNFQTHGHPYKYHEPQREDKKKRPTGKSKKSKTRDCSNCGYKNQIYHANCIQCGKNLLPDIEIKIISGELRRVTDEERDEAVRKRLTQIMHFENKEEYAFLNKDFRYHSIMKRFGRDHFYKSKHVPDEVKKRFADMEAKKKLK